MLKTSDVYRSITRDPITVFEDENIHSVTQKITRGNPASRCAYVLNKSNELVGMITLGDLLKVIAIRKGLTANKKYSVRVLFEYISKDLSAKKIMRTPVYVNVEDNLEEALQKLVTHGIEEIAVVDNNQIIGELNVYELLCGMVNEEDD